MKEVELEWDSFEWRWKWKIQRLRQTFGRKDSMIGEERR